MELEKKLKNSLLTILKPKISINKIFASSPWDLIIELIDKNNNIFTIKSLKSNDLNLIIDFKSSLSQNSKDLFCPYPWENKKSLEKSIEFFLEKCEKKIDVGYILLFGKKPIGHFFLWGATRNEQSIKFGISVPELGVAISDEFQGKGWGKISIEILKLIAKNLNCNAIELSTAISNQNAFQAYIKSGFIFTGIIKNPLEIDATNPDLLAPKKFREEKQMIYIISPDKENKILNYLSLKRKEYGELALQ